MCGYIGMYVRIALTNSTGILVCTCVCVGGGGWWCRGIRFTHRPFTPLTSSTNQITWVFFSTPYIHVRQSDSYYFNFILNGLTSFPLTPLISPLLSQLTGLHTEHKPHFPLLYPLLPSSLPSFTLSSPFLSPHFPTSYLHPPFSSSSLSPLLPPPLISPLLPSPLIFHLSLLSRLTLHT